MTTAQAVSRIAIAATTYQGHGPSQSSGVAAAGFSTR